MKIVYQQRNKLKNIGVLFPMTNENISKMLYAYYLINKRYTNCDYTCAKTNTFEVEKIFNLVVKINGPDTVLNIIKSYITETTHRKILLILDNFIFNGSKDESKPSYNYRLPNDLPKKGMHFDLYNDKLVNLRITQRNSIIKYYQVCRHTCMFLDIGKKDSNTRNKIVEKLKDISSIDALITLKRQIENLECTNEKVENIDTIYKILKRKKIALTQSEPTNVVRVSSLEIDKYGVKLSSTKSYKLINERIDNQLKKK